MIRKVLILSDSHGQSKNIKKAIASEAPDMLIHLGDIEDETEKIRNWLDEAAVVWNTAVRSSEAVWEKKSLPIPAVFIKGNCDRYGDDNELKETAVFEVNSHRFFCSHGHKYGVGMGVDTLIYNAMENECDIALFGHTHVPFDDFFEGYGGPGEGVRVLNPGSISLPRGKNRKSYMIMSFDDSGDYTVELKEL